MEAAVFIKVVANRDRIESSMRQHGSTRSGRVERSVTFFPAALFSRQNRLTKVRRLGNANQRNARPPGFFGSRQVSAKIASHSKIFGVDGIVVKQGVGE